MHKLKMFGAAASLTLFTALACGGEDEAGDDGFSIPDSAVLGTLTDPQRETLCTETKAYLSRTGLDADFREITCLASGIVAASQMLTAGDAALKAACKGAYDSCVAGAMPIACATLTPTCMATVGEYKACLSEADSASAQALTLLPPCDELTLAKLLSLAAAGEGAIPPTPACDAFEAKCPDVDIPIPEVPGT